MAWIDYKKVYDFVPHSWINECMELFGTADNARNFLERDISGRQFFITVVCFDYRTFVVYT